MSQEKISCLISLGPPPNEKISCLLSHEKISCLKRKSHVFSVLGPTPMRKSPVSSLRRKSHVPRENLMSFHFWVPPSKKIYCLLSPEKISFIKRKSHVLSVLGPPYKKIFCLLSHKKISCLKRKSYVLSVLGPPSTRKSPVSCLMRKSHVSRENLMSYQFWPPQLENLLSLVS